MPWPDSSTPPWPRAGALARPVLVALGLRPDGKKEIIDFRLASAESAAQWEEFLGDLVHRGLTGERLEMLCVDGGAGLLAALPMAFPDIPVQRCWAHKMRNVLNRVRKPDQIAIKADLHRIMNARTLPAAWSAARRFADRWESTFPKAVACLCADLDDLLTCFRHPTLEQRKAVRTTDEIDKGFVLDGGMVVWHGRPRGEQWGRERPSTSLARRAALPRIKVIRRRMPIARGASWASVATDLRGAHKRARPVRRSPSPGCAAP